MKFELKVIEVGDFDHGVVVKVDEEEDGGAVTAVKERVVDDGRCWMLLTRRSPRFPPERVLAWPIWVTTLPPPCIITPSDPPGPCLLVHL